MSYINDYMRHIEKHALPELRKQLQTLLSDEPMHERKLHATGWMDSTGRQIALLMRAITDYEDFLTEHLAKVSTRRASNDQAPRSPARDPAQLADFEH